VTAEPARPSPPAGLRPRRVSVLAVAVVSLGFAGSVLLGLVGNSGAPHKQNVYWPWLPPLAEPRIGAAAALGVARAGLLALALAWIGLGLLVRGRTVGTRLVVVAAALWAVPLLMSAPLFSDDVYDYAAGGALVVHHLDPYLVGPHSLGAAQRVVSTVSPAWSQTASPYGPLFLLVAAAVARVAGQHDIVAVTLLRVVALGALVATIVVLSRLAATLGRPPAPAVWLVAANPLVITAYVGGAHNDVLMMALLCGGLLLHAHGRALSALLLVVAAAEVKVVALAVLAMLLADMRLRADGSTRPRVLRDAALSCTMFVVGTSLLGLPLGHGLLGGWGWQGPVIANLCPALVPRRYPVEKIYRHAAATR